jgi:hypothetical protein
LPLNPIVIAFNCSLFSSLSLENLSLNCYHLSLVPRSPSCHYRCSRLSGNKCVSGQESNPFETSSHPTSISMNSNDECAIDDASNFVFRFVPILDCQDYHCKMLLSRSASRYLDKVSYGILQSFAHKDCYLSLDCINQIISHCSKYPASSLWSMQPQHHCHDQNQSGMQNSPQTSKSGLTTMTLQYCGRVKDILVQVCSSYHDRMNMLTSIVSSHSTPMKDQY